MEENGSLRDNEILDLLSPDYFESQGFQDAFDYGEQSRNTIAPYTLRSVRDLFPFSVRSISKLHRWRRGRRIRLSFYGRAAPIDSRGTARN